MKFSQRVGAVLTVLVVHWVSVAGAGGSAGAIELVSASGAKVMAGQLSETKMASDCPQLATGLICMRA